MYKKIQPFYLVTLFYLVTISSISYAGSLPDFTHLVEENSAAIVNISTTQKARESVSQLQLPKGLELPDDSPLNDLFKHFLDKRGGGMPRQGKSLGSGFIISKDGYLITNHHVVKNADEIVVRLQDRRELIAELVGSDEKSDIALLKIDATKLPVVKFGSVKKLKVGAWVLAIGSPFGFDHSVTAGIVSAKGRSLPSENYIPFIQTDVAINPGNSGGPLFNMDGEVVGINSQIFSRTGGFMGLSFAIPVDMALNVVEQIKRNGHVTRGWLGVLIQDVTRELAESFGMERPYGALVSQVVPDSPSDRGGIQVGDVIIEFNGSEVDRSSTLPPLVGKSPVDKKAEVKVIRGGKTIRLQVKIAALPEQIADSGSVQANKQSKMSRIGVAVVDLTAEELKDTELSGEGVRVEKIEQGDALTAGIRVGDIILKVQGHAIKNSVAFREITAKLKAGTSVALLIQRNGNPLFLALKVTN
ncbi:MAG: serine peptidase [Gammaproteobacteria bacterium]|nr:MAG: serine peptidase [Gammaproteobacteria bacterium]